MANGHGGARPGAGRPPGALTQKTREILTAARESGRLPLDIMLTLMNESYDYYQLLKEAEAPSIQAIIAAQDRCFAYAKDAAPFCHPRLNAIKSEASNGDMSYQLELSQDECNL